MDEPIKEPANVKYYVKTLKLEQRNALEAGICSEQDEYQAAWNKPRRYGYTKKLVFDVVLAVVRESDGLKWAAGIRIAHAKKKKYKSVLSWTAAEKAIVRRMLGNELLGLGLDNSSTEFSTSYAIHLTRLLTEEEAEVAERDAIFIDVPQPQNGHKPVITREADAIKHLDKMEADFRDDSLIIKPGDILGKN